MQKGFAPIFIIILMVLVAGGYLIYQIKTTPYVVLQTDNQSSPTPTSFPEPTNSVVSPVPSNAEETKVWETYANDQLGVQFDYPGDSKILDVSENTKRVGKIGGTSYFFEVTRINTNENLETWWSHESKKSLDMLLLDLKTTFNNRPAYHLKENTVMVQVPMESYMVQMDGYLLEIVYTSPYNMDLPPEAYKISTLPKSYYEDSNKGYSKGMGPIIDQMLSTFRFD